MKKLILFLAMILCLGVCLSGSAEAIPSIALDTQSIRLDGISNGAIEQAAKAPYSVGGWKPGAIVSFPVNVEEADLYWVVLRYSKEGPDAPVEVRIRADHSEDYVTKTIFPTAQNWFVYTDICMGLLRVSPEDTYLTWKRWILPPKLNM